MLSSLQDYSWINVVMALGYRLNCCVFTGSVRREKITTLLCRHCALATTKAPRLPIMWHVPHVNQLCSYAHLAWASSRLWSVMVMICCNMSPMSCFLPSPSAPPEPSCMCCARPGCPAMPTPWECINRGCSSILDHGSATSPAPPPKCRSLSLFFKQRE